MPYRIFIRHFTIALALVPMFACVAEDVEGDLVFVREAPQAPSNSWIVVFGPGVSVDSRVAEIAADHEIAVEHTYHHALRGFSFRGSEQAAAQIANLGDVAYIEPDQIATILDKPDGVGKPGGGSSDQVVPWGVTRVGGGESSGSGTAWVIDTGIDLDHPDLNVDVERSVNYVAIGKPSPDDGHGHGTHVAGTIAAIDNDIDVIGVAPGAPLVAVRVLDNNGSGTYSAVIDGVDHVIANAEPGDVANMSLGGPPSNALDDAVITAAKAGIRFAIAAGNDDANAGNYSPARVDHANVYTVSAIASSDCLTSWSNWGMPPVDVAAPGSSILSTRNNGGTTTKSGTSMAAPHVAGLLLLGTVQADGMSCSPDASGDQHPIAHD